MMKSNTQLIVSTSFVSTYIMPLFGDGGALLMGLSLCGALVFVMNSREISIIGRMVYTFVAAFIGFALAYPLEASELVRGLVAFGTSAVVVGVTIKLIEFVWKDFSVRETIDMILKFIGRGK